MKTFVVLACMLLGCSLPDADARVGAGEPSRADFLRVAPVYARRCGSLDCHGSAYRNFRVYGYGGQRLGTATPDAPNWVTADEANATFDSLVALEPDLLRDVVSSGGAEPERLTLVRKGRGDEDHKGDRRITPGDPSDRCITSWLAGAVDVAACDEGGCVIDTPPGEPPRLGQCP